MCLCVAYASVCMGNWQVLTVCVVLLQPTTVATNLLDAVMLTAQTWCHYLSRTNDATCVYKIGSFWYSAALLLASKWMDIPIWQADEAYVPVAFSVVRLFNREKVTSLI